MDDSIISTKLDVLIEMTRGLQARMDRNDDRMRDVEGTVRELGGRIAEQSNILAALIPIKVAAVGGR